MRGVFLSTLQVAYTRLSPDATLRELLERLLRTCRFARSPAGLFVSLPGATPVLRSLGAVFDEDLSAQQPHEAAPSNASHRRVLGPERPPSVQHVYTGPAPEGLDAALDASDDGGDEDARGRARKRSAALEHAVNAVRAPEAQEVHEPVTVVIGPAMPPPPPPAAEAARRVLGPMAPPPEVLEAAAEDTGFAVGPPPPEVVSEAESATSETRDQAVSRVLRLLDAIPTGGAGDAYMLLGVDENATAGDVRKAFWRASLLMHPDKCAHPRAADAFAAITKAKDVLADASQRRALDEKRSEARLRAEFQADLEGRIQAAKWRQTRGLPALPEDAELLRLASGNSADAAGGREEWMTMLPELQTRTGAVAQRSVTAFRQTERAERDNSWAETPQQRAERERQYALEGVRGALAGPAQLEPGQPHGVQVSRQESLLEKHQARLAKAGPAAQQQPARPFDRERDLQAPRKPVDLSALQQHGGSLASRFSGPRQS